MATLVGPNVGHIALASRPSRVALSCASVRNAVVVRRSPMLTSSASADHRQPVQVDLVVLHPAEPVLGTADETGEHLLRLPAASPVEGDTVADGRGLGHPSHASSLPTARETTPELVERQWQRSCPSNSASASSAALPVRQGQAV
jgi:hypothetical protein